MTLIEKLEREIKRLDREIFVAGDDRRGVASGYDQEAADLRELLEEAVVAIRNQNEISSESVTYRIEC